MMAVPTSRNTPRETLDGRKRPKRNSNLAIDNVGAGRFGEIHSAGPSARLGMLALP